YYGARYYDPQLGRFITPDTVIQNPYDPQTLNRYTYTRNNPIIYVDPSGHGFFSDIGHFFSGVGNTLSGLGPAFNVALQIFGGPPGLALGSWGLSETRTGSNILAGELFAQTAVATFMCGGCGAGIGALSGELIGGYSAAKSGGDILSGVAVGGAIGA